MNEEEISTTMIDTNDSNVINQQELPPEEDVGGTVTTSRTRRSTRFTGNFQTRYAQPEISSDDEDEGDDEKGKKKQTRQRGKRTKECPGCGAVIGLSSRQCDLCDYQFTSKSMIQSTQAAQQESVQIREKFPFEPERDDDGSLIVQTVLARRPRMSGHRPIKTSGSLSFLKMNAMDAKYDYEYLVKYKNMSYLHLKWLSGAEIEAMNPRSIQMLTKFLSKIDRGEPEPQEDDIEPSFTEVEKVLDYREQEVIEVVHEVAESNNVEVVQEAADDSNGSADDSTNDMPTSASSGTLLQVEKKDGEINQINGEQTRPSNNSIFQPGERCRRVLEKIWEDPYSLSFQEPVDTEAFPDYLDIISEPICLSDIKKKIERGEYNRWGNHRVFAQDMRKIWRNCKMYNLYQSQIWQCAHALALLFERLYQAWVVSYADATLPMSNPLARPWELSCRTCLQEGNDDEMILCDHCDAPFHIYCLTPKLHSVPEESWICPRCTQWLQRSGSKVLTATMEDEARKLVEGAKKQKVVKVKQKKYLVKWRGLSYNDCTWETANDINDDEVIAKYHQLNDAPPDEPPLTQAEIGVELAKDRKDQLFPAGMKGTRENPILDLDAQIYAQIRAFHFLKWKKMVPDALMREAGPAAYASVLGTRDSMALPLSVLKKVKEISSQAQKVLSERLSALGVSSHNEEEDEAESEDGDETYGTETESADFSAIEDEIREEEENDKNSRRKKVAAVNESSPPQGIKVKQSGGKARLTTPPSNGKHQKDNCSTSKDKRHQENSSAATEDDAIAECKQVAWYVASLTNGDPIRHIVTDCLSDIIYAVARDHEKAPIFEYPSRPLLPSRYQAPSEIETCVAKGHDSLCMKIGNFQGNVVVLGFRQLPGGGRGPVERTNKVRIGDLLVAIDGLYIHGMKFVDTVKLLSSSTQPFMYLRFLRYPPCKEGRKPDAISKYFAEIPKKKHSSSYRPLFPRSKYHGVFPFINLQYMTPTDDIPAENQLKRDAVRTALRGAKAMEAAASLYVSENSLQDAAEGTGLRWSAEYMKDFERTQIEICESEESAALAYDAAVNMESPRKKRILHPNFTHLPADNEDTSKLKLTASASSLARRVETERQLSKDRLNKLQAMLTKKPKTPEINDLITATKEGSCPDSNEKTKIDSVGKAQSTANISKEGDITSQVDTCTEANTSKDVSPVKDGKLISVANTAAKNDKEQESEIVQVSAQEEDISDDEEWSDFHSLDSQDSDSEFEERRRKVGSMQGSSENESEGEEEEEGDNDDNEWAEDDDVDWIPNSNKNSHSVVETQSGPITRLLHAVNQSDYPPIKHEWTKYILEHCIENRKTTVIDENHSSKQSSSKTRRVDQIDLANGEIVRSWDSANTAARTMKLKTADILLALAGKIDQAGGFRWEFSRLTSSETAKMSVEEIEAEEALEEANERRKEESWKAKLPKTSKVYKSGGTLRDYQVEGLSWLLRCWYSKRSCILADEMGLGKTVQVVTFLDHLFETEKIRGPFLICVPLSTIGHWEREFESWSHMISCVYHDAGGGRDMRDAIREYEWYYKGRSRRLLKFHVIITTYDDLVRDYEELAEIPWRCVIVDEAHRLRNVNSKLLECMRSVVTKGQVSYGYQHRILMTGTPLQNNTIELWSLMNFIEPAKFPDLEKFQSRFGKIETQEQVENLQRRIAPHLLRRVKEDVAKDIPPKEETIIDVELTTMQKQYYRAIFEQNHGFLMQNLKGNMPKLMNIQMELRKCCNHPFLIAGVEITEMDNLDEKIENSSANDDNDEFERRRMEEYLIPSSGKMVLLDKLLPKLKKEGHKVLIFSQMVKMIDMIGEFCEFRNYPCERLDGAIRGNDRQKAIDRYNSNANSFIFLLSTRAGGVGINLTAADTVIIFDSDWNPQNDIQAMARCHRIGQSKSVTIYRLITRKSFEAEMFERASKKLGLEQAVLGTRNFNDIDLDENDAGKGPKMNAKEMEQLLREGAYAVLLEDDADDIKDFYEQDIDLLLQQRSHKLVTEAPQQGTESWLNKRKKSGRTSKRMFTGDSAKEHAEIDVNDPDFWKKVLPDLVTPDIMLERLNDGTLLDEDDEPIRRAVTKYMKDMSQMMEGMLDLSRRNTLPDRERTLCMKLLLRLTLKDEIFTDDEISKAQEWLSVIEGTRSRRAKMNSSKTDPRKKSPANKKDSAKLKKNRNAGKAEKKVNTKKRAREIEQEIRHDDEDDDHYSAEVQGDGGDDDDDYFVEIHSSDFHDSEEEMERPRKRNKTNTRDTANPNSEVNKKLKKGTANGKSVKKGTKDSPKSKKDKKEERTVKELNEYDSEVNVKSRKRRRSRPRKFGYEDAERDSAEEGSGNDSIADV